MKLSQITESLDQYLPEPRQFKYGDCGYEVYFMAVKAVKSGFDKFIVVDGMVDIGNNRLMPHTWIELLDGTVKDPTQNQFNSQDLLYSPPDEYREEYSPTEYIEYFIEEVDDDPKPRQLHQ